MIPQVTSKDTNRAATPLSTEDVHPTPSRADSSRARSSVAREEAGKRSTPRLLAVAIATLGCAGAAGCGEPSSAAQEVTSTSAELTATADARAAVIRQAKQREIGDYLQRRARGWRVVETRRSPTGTEIDYVAAETMYPDSPQAPFATPPPKRMPSVANGVGRALPETELDARLRPPPGTVPVIRPRFDRYLPTSFALL